MITDILKDVPASIRKDDDLAWWPTDIEYVRLKAGADQMGAGSEVFPGG